MANADRPPRSTGQASDFYNACRNGELHRVDRLLKTMTNREINKIEDANNSTALHAASYYGRTDVVKRLLEVGANVHTRNGYGLTAEEEAQIPEVKAIFQQFKNN
jgi:ankyrin repeat protein